MPTVVKQSAFYLLVAIIVVIAVFPFYYAIITSLNPAARSSTSAIGRRE